MLSGNPARHSDDRVTIDRLSPDPMPEPALPPRLAAAASVIGHLALVAAIVLLAAVRPFQSESPAAIAVDLVTPEQIAPPEPPAKPPEPDVTLPDLKPSVESPPAPQAAQPQQQQQAAPQPPAPQPASEPPAETAQAAQPQPAAPSPPAAPPPPAATGFTPPEPDLTVKYGVPLGLPEASGKSDFDAAAFDVAKLASTDIAAFRRHLKTCSPMPEGVAASDDVWIKLRVRFAPDGHLAAPPALIEGKASPKAIALAHGAIAALQTCQPYAMLPGDKYAEWRLLDLEFTPRDFSER